jgi:hypothetical protein
VAATGRGARDFGELHRGALAPSPAVKKDFAPVTNLVFTNNTIVAAGNAPFNKVNPGEITWATWVPAAFRTSVSKR